MSNSKSRPRNGKLPLVESRLLLTLSPTQAHRLTQAQITLGKNILRFREMRGLTVTEVAEQCHIRPLDLQDIEAGQGSPTLYTIIDIAKSLKVTIEEIFQGVQ